jgi:hypothetical protein
VDNPGYLAFGLAQELKSSQLIAELFNGIDPLQPLKNRDNLAL